MGASDAMSSKGEKFASPVDMDIDDEEELNERTPIKELGEDFLQKFCKDASLSFFNEYGLISHQINSYNDFIKNGVQRLVDSFGELIVEPGFDPSKKGESDWRYASVRFGKVTLDRPSFWGGVNKDNEYHLLPRHARLQNMTYSSRMKVHVHIEVNKVETLSPYICLCVNLCSIILFALLGC